MSILYTQEFAGKNRIKMKNVNIICLLFCFAFSTKITAQCIGYTQLINIWKLESDQQETQILELGYQVGSPWTAPTDPTYHQLNYVRNEKIDSGYTYWSETISTSNQNSVAYSTTNKQCYLNIKKIVTSKFKLFNKILDSSGYYRYVYHGKINSFEFTHYKNNIDVSFYYFYIGTY